MAADSHTRVGRDDSSARPTWWVLLAVSMAIMALVFARSAGDHHPKTPAIAIDPSILPRFVNRSGPSISQTLKQVSPIPRQSTTTTTPITHLPSSASPHIQTPPTYSTMPTYSTTETAGSVQSYPGYLSYPDDIATSYPIHSVGGNITASVSLVASSNVEVSINCSDAQRSATGMSAVAVSMVGATSPCTVQVADETDTSEPIAYSLTVTTSSGS